MCIQILHGPVVFAGVVVSLVFSKILNGDGLSSAFSPETVEQEEKCGLNTAEKC